MTTQSQQFIRELQEIIAQKHLLQHPFYQSWTAGTLPLSVLRQYALQYLHLEKNFPRLLSIIHAQCEDFSLRQSLSDNLHDEEHGEENHRELWLRFSEALGNDRADALAKDPLPETTEAIECFREVCRKSPLEGIAALAVYESQIPEVATSKLAGLTAHYGITDDHATAFFRVHQIADTVHRQSWWDAIAQHAQTPQERALVRDAVLTTRDALWSFLDGVYRAYMPAPLGAI